MIAGRHTVRMRALLALTMVLIAYQLYTSFRLTKDLSVVTASKKLPRYEVITFTNVGWLHPDRNIANNTFRCIAAKEFVEAVLAHERYNQSAWTANASNPVPTLVFLDVDTLQLLHYPHFGGGDGETNADTEGGRPRNGRRPDVCESIKLAFQQNSTALQHKDSRLAILLGDENGADGMVHEQHCLNPKLKHLLRDEWHEKIVVGYMSAHYSTVHDRQRDFGLPPWPVKRVHMSPERLQDLHNCKERPIEMSFRGRGRNSFPEFSAYFDALKDDDRYRFLFTVQHYIDSPLVGVRDKGLKVIAPTHKANQTSDTYYAWIMNSTFCPTSRGDNLYSVRFSEVLSAGCIPILFGDGWVLPYNSETVSDWNSMAVILPQSEINSTKDITLSISKEQRCQMQKNIFEFYNKYVNDSAGRLNAILKLMDARLHHGTVNLTYVPSSNSHWTRSLNIT